MAFFKRFYFYIHFLTFKAVSTIVYNGAIYFFIRDDMMLTSYKFLIIQEVLQSTVYNTLKIKMIKNTNLISAYFYISVLLCTMSVLFIVYYFGLNYNSIFLCLSFVIFPFYLLKVVDSEIINVDVHVKKENKIALLSVVLSSLTILILYFYNVHESFVLLLRGLFLVGLFFVFLHDIKITKFISFRNIITLSKKEIFSYFLGFEYFIYLFYFKYTFFHVLGELDNSAEVGELIKIFMYSYDVIAAVLGLYLRRLFVKDIKNDTFEKNTCCIFYFLTLLNFISLLLYFVFNQNIFFIMYMVTVFVSTASILTLIVSFKIYERLITVIPLFILAYLSVYYINMTFIYISPLWICLVFITKYGFNIFKGKKI